MSSSGTMRRSLNTDVVGANEPIPSVSKKFVTAPRPICVVVGRAGPVALFPGRRTRRNQ